MKQDDTLVVNDKQAMNALKKHGGNIVWVIVLVLAGFFGWQYYQKNYAKIDTAAADSYTTISEQDENLAQLAQNPDTKAQFDEQKNQLFADIDKLVATHGGSVYAWQALMIKARHQSDGDDYQGASESLTKASQMPIDDQGLLAISRLQLAQVQLADGKYDVAMTTLGGTFPTSFESSRLEISGDIYVAKNDNGNAKQSYEKAWALLSERQESRALLKLKMQALGLEPAAIEPKAPIVSELSAVPALPMSDVATQDNPQNQPADHQPTQATNVQDVQKANGNDDTANTEQKEDKASN